MKPEKRIVVVNFHKEALLPGLKEISLGNKGIAVMAVDNLPSELPRDSSEEFGSSVISEILPYFINKDDGRIHRATTASNGKFLKNFTYLNDFINQ